MDRHADGQTNRSRAMRAEKRWGHRGGQKGGERDWQEYVGTERASWSGSSLFICSLQLKYLAVPGDDLSHCWDPGEA